jgi:hypothetical protein
MVSEAVWKRLKEQIEYHIKADTSISDISINYQIKKAKNRNYLRLNITTDD